MFIYKENKIKYAPPVVSVAHIFFKHEAARIHFFGPITTPYLFTQGLARFDPVYVSRYF